VNRNSPARIRTLSDSSGKTALPETRGIKSGNIPGDEQHHDARPPADPPPPTMPLIPADPDLAAVVRAWPDLPPAIRAGMVAIVRAADAGKGAADA
jgi:hypothetical protein